jgi:alpha-D-ribose 1-methylphosphonate 5-triphosphate synthase subunit PhnH
MEDLGQAPKMFKSEKNQWDNSLLDSIGKMGVDRASEDAARNEKSFGRDMQLKQMAAEQDPNSQKAQQANLLYKAVLSNKAKEAEMAGDKATAAQIRGQIRDMQPMGAKDAMYQMEGIKNLDYKDILSSMATQRAADNTLKVKGLELASEQGKEAKKDEQYKTGLTLDLQKQVAGDQVVKNAAHVNKTLSQVEQGLYSRTQTAFDDQKLIVSFNKALDEGSVVKESEFALTAAGASLIERAKQAAEQYKTGTRLSPEMRTQLIQTMRDLRDGYNNYLQGHLSKYQNTASKLGLDPSLVFGDQPFMNARAPVQGKQGSDLLNDVKSPGQPMQVAPKSDWRNHK